MSIYPRNTLLKAKCILLSFSTCWFSLCFDKITQLETTMIYRIWLVADVNNNKTSTRTTLPNHYHTDQTLYEKSFIFPVHDKFSNRADVNEACRILLRSGMPNKTSKLAMNIPTSKSIIILPHAYVYWYIAFVFPILCHVCHIHTKERCMIPRGLAFQMRVELSGCQCPPTWFNHTIFGHCPTWTYNNARPYVLTTSLVADPSTTSRVPLFAASTMSLMVTKESTLCNKQMMETIIRSVNSSGPVSYLKQKKLITTLNGDYPAHTPYIPWASCQMRKIAHCTCAGNAGNIFTATAGWRTCRDACRDG